MGICESREQVPDYQFGRSTIQPKMSEYPNFDFYKGVYPFQLNQAIVFHIKHWRDYNQLYQWVKFYQDLESDRQFMQWLYPNFFQSFLNTTSFRLTPKERNLFLENPQIIKQYQENVEMFQRFLGIAKNTDDQLDIVDNQQFEQCIYSYTHNQVRIQRFISSMSILGMRNEALQFLKVLENQLTKQHSVYKAKFAGFQQLAEEVDMSAKSLVTKTQPGKSFQELKNHYVQEDLINEPWVTTLILTNEPITIPSERHSYEIKKEI